MPKNEKTPGQQFVDLMKFVLILLGIAVIAGMYLMVRG